MHRVVSFFIFMVLCFFVSAYSQPEWYLGLRCGAGSVMMPEYNNSVRQANAYNSSVGINTGLEELNWGISPELELGFNFNEPAGTSAAYLRAMHISLKSGESYAFWDNGALAQKLSSDLSAYYAGFGIKKHFFENLQVNPYVSFDGGICFSSDNCINEESRQSDGSVVSTLRKEWDTAIPGFNAETGVNWMLGEGMGLNFCIGYRYAAGDIMVSVKDNQTWTGGYQAVSRADYSGMYLSAGMLFGINEKQSGIKNTREDYRELSASLLKEAIAYHDSGKAEKAYMKLKEAEKIDPENEDIKLYMEKVKAMQPNRGDLDLKALFNEAEEARMKKKHSEAYVKLLKIISADPENAEALTMLEDYRQRAASAFRLSEELYAAGNRTEAMKQAKNALEYEPDSGKISAFVEKISAEKRDRKKAVNVYNEGVDKFQKEDYAEAIRLWGLVTEIYPEDRDAAANIKIAQKKAAEKKYETLEALNSINEEAEKAYELGMLDEARLKCELALRLAPDNIQAKNMLDKINGGINTGAVNTGAIIKR